MKKFIGTVMVLGAVSLLGCAEAKKAGKAEAEKAAAAAHEAGEKASEAGHHAAEAAGKAGEAVVEETKSVGAKVEGAIEGGERRRCRRSQVVEFPFAPRAEGSTIERIHWPPGATPWRPVAFKDGGSTPSRSH